MLPRGAQRREVKREERVQSECGAPANAESFSRLANRQDVLHRVFKLSRARVEHGCLQKLLCKYRRGSEPARANQELSQLTGFASSLLRERFDGMLLLPGGVASGDGVLLGCLRACGRQTTDRHIASTDRVRALMRPRYGVLTEISSLSLISKLLKARDHKFNIKSSTDSAPRVTTEKRIYHPFTRGYSTCQPHNRDPRATHTGRHAHAPKFSHTRHRSNTASILTSCVPLPWARARASRSSRVSAATPPRDDPRASRQRTRPPG